MRQAISLRSRLALWVALLVCLLSWVLGAVIGHESSERIREEIGHDLGEVAYQMVDRLDRDMAQRASMLQVLGNLEALRDLSDIGEVKKLLNSLNREFPAISWIGLTDPAGLVLASTDGILEGVSLAQRPVYIEGRKGLFIGDVHDAVLLAKVLPNPSGEAMKFVDIALPVLDAKHQLVSVLVSHLSWRWTDDVRRAVLEPMQERRNVEALIIGSDRTILLGPNAMIGQHLPLPALDSPHDTDSFYAVQTWPDGKQYLTGFAPSHGSGNYPGLGWTVVTRQPLEQAYAPATALQTEILIGGSAAALVFAFIGWLLAGYISKPLHEIANAADKLSAGEIAVLPELRGTREVEALSQSLRHLVESLTNQQNALGVMESRAYQDPLTGLANRAALDKHLTQTEHHNRRTDNSVALLYLDLDGFKPVNDTYGHASGDKLLQEVAKRLRLCLREHDLVARLGGDEFVMALHVIGPQPLEQALQIAQRALSELAEPIQLGEHSVQISCSIGGALWPQQHSDMTEVLKLADQSLYQAKHEGKNRVVFYPSE